MDLIFGTINRGYFGQILTLNDQHKKLNLLRPKKHHNEVYLGKCFSTALLSFTEFVFYFYFFFLQCSNIVHMAKVHLPPMNKFACKLHGYIVYFSNLKYFSASKNIFANPSKVAPTSNVAPVYGNTRGGSPDWWGVRTSARLH